MTTRHEWVSDSTQHDEWAETEAPTLATFAYTQTADVLAVEPRLATLATLVEHSGLSPDEMPYLESLVSLLVGPSRVKSLLGPSTAQTVSVSSTLFALVTRRRFMEALRAATR